MVIPGIDVPPPDFRLAHLSDAEFEALVGSLPSTDVSRPWLEFALVHPSYLRSLGRQLRRRDPAAILLQALEQAGEAALNLSLVAMAVLDLDLATPAEANVVVQLARQSDPARLIAERYALATHAAYGREAEVQLSDRHAKTRWLKSIGSAFLGACSLHRFQNAHQLVTEVVDQSELTPRAIDSHKTVLQELASKRGLPHPIYSLIEASGPDHDRFFRVAVSVGRLRAEGKGTSKKLAEEAAAREILVRRMPGAANPAGVRARPERPGSSFHFGRLPAKERRSLEELAMGLAMPRSASSLARAFIHSSYAFENALRPEESNAALALLGSAVLNVWGTRLQLASLVGHGTGAPEVLTTSLWDVSVCAEAARAMGLRQHLLVGRGERNPSQRIVGEAFQALVGAMFAELGEPGTIAERLPEAVTVLRASFELGWLDPKTKLERRLRPSGIRIEYQQDERGPDHRKEYAARVTLASPQRNQSVRVKGTRWKASKTAAEKAAAATVLQALFADLSETDEGNLDRMEAEIQRLVARHECAVAPSSRSDVTEWFRRGALGTNFLKLERFQSFLAWTQLLDNLDEDDEEQLASFYRTCGESDVGIGRALVSEGSRSLLDWITGRGVDQSGLGVLETTEFRQLLDLAVLTRLSTSPNVPLKIRDEIENFALLERTHGRRIEVGRLPDMSILAVEGALPKALARLIDQRFGEGTGRSVSIGGHADEGLLQVTIRSTEGLLPEADPPQQEDTLFTFLRTALGILQVTNSEDVVEVTFRLPPEGETEGSRLLIAYLSPSRFSDPERFDIARVLHDLKNEVIAYGVSLRRWWESGREDTTKLALQYETGRHLDAAQGLASSLATLTSTLTPPRLEEIDFVLFLQEYLSRKILAIPATVRLVTPRTSIASLRVFTAPPYLLSILDNLIKNAVEAMPDGGDLRVDWAYEEGERKVILEISDTGAGMEPSQVAALQANAPIESTKPGGSALGIATVRGMVYRLGGDLDVSSSPEDGTRWTLTLPDLQESAP